MLPSRENVSNEVSKTAAEKRALVGTESYAGRLNGARGSRHLGLLTKDRLPLKVVGAIA